MDWNRQKEIAEKKMLVKDFVGAKNVALEAQQLFSDLDSISQMLTGCEVHCCAGTKVNGQMDWYGILQVGQTVDRSSLRKQYLKLAFLLHPDKNKFPGAEAAFHLICEARRTLSDPNKRFLHDKKRGGIEKVLQRVEASYQAYVTSFAREKYVVGNNFTSTATFQCGNIIDQWLHGHNTTFWATCPKCCIKFQYHYPLNEYIKCHNCLTNYTASEFVEQAVPCPLGSSINMRNHTWSGSGINMTRGNGEFESKQNEVPPEKVNIEKMDKENPAKPAAANACRRASREGVDVEVGVPPEEQNASPSRRRYPQRSCQMKQKVTYKEARIDDDDDDDFPGHKRARKAAPHHANDDNVDTTVVCASREGVDVEVGVLPEEQNASPSRRRYPQRSCQMKQKVTYKEARIDDDDEDFSSHKRARKAAPHHDVDTTVVCASREGVDVEVGVLPEEQNASPSRRRCPRRSCQMKQKVTYKEARIDDDDDYFPIHKWARKAAPHHAEKLNFSKGDSDHRTPTSKGNFASSSIDEFLQPQIHDFQEDRSFDKFNRGQIWALYSDMDKYPKVYVKIKKVDVDDISVSASWVELLSESRSSDQGCWLYIQA